jgi:hypothetical protein
VAKICNHFFIFSVLECKRDDVEIGTGRNTVDISSKHSFKIQACGLRIHLPGLSSPLQNTAEKQGSLLPKSCQQAPAGLRL